MAHRYIGLGVAAIVLAGSCIDKADAQSPAEFYAGKTIDMVIGYSLGGGYDLYARLIARHLGDHIPGRPTISPRNMSGAASLLLANWLYGAAPRDGTAIGAMSRGAAFDPLLGNIGAQFEAPKFNWLGSANDEVSVCVALSTSGVARFTDLLAKPLTIGATGVGDDTYQFPMLMNKMMGTKFKIINGFPGSKELTRALERGDVQGRCGWSWSSLKAVRADWVASKKLIVLVQMSLSKHPDLPDVPLVTDLANTDEQRHIFKLIFARQVMGRPFAAPPEVPAGRVRALRQAFAETMSDQAFLKDAEKSNLEINPVSGDRLQALVNEIYKTPPEMAKQAAALLR